MNKATEHHLYPTTSPRAANQHPIKTGWPIYKDNDKQNSRHNIIPLVMSPRLLMKRLQSNCPTQRTNQYYSVEPEPQERTSFSKLLSNFRSPTFTAARPWKTFACPQVPTREQLSFLHKCPRANVLPTGVNHRSTTPEPYRNVENYNTIP